MKVWIHMVKKQGEGTKQAWSKRASRRGSNQTTQEGYSLDSNKKTGKKERWGNCSSPKFGRRENCGEGKNTSFWSEDKR